uniref:hypothetical protein n=1 Tax=Oleiagrimonas sp. TaxID=2010330 RepID=UPI00262C7651
MHAQSMDLCRLVRSTVHGQWQHHFYAASSVVSGIMVAAMDGDTTAVRKGLAALPPDQIARWRQTALSQAVLGMHPSTVRDLIAEGADPNGRAWIPPYDARIYRQVMKDPRLGA